MTGSNRRPPACDAGALPAELISLRLARCAIYSSPLGKSTAPVEKHEKKLAKRLIRSRGRTFCLKNSQLLNDTEISQAGFFIARRQSPVRCGQATADITHGVSCLPYSIARGNLLQYAPAVASVLVVAAFAVWLAGQIGDWRQLANTPLPESGTAGPATSLPADPRQLDILFGPPPTAPDALAGQSPGRLVLHGSFVHADPRQSAAILQLEGEPPLLYRQGAEVPSGSTLHGVYADRVELLHNGHLQALYFPESRSVAALPEAFPDYGEQQTPAQPQDQQSNSEIEALRQQMDVLRQQLEGNLPSDE